MSLFTWNSPDAGNGTGGFPYNQLGFDDVLGVQLGTWAVNTLEENLSGGASHFAQGLAHGGEAGILEGGVLNVVESDYGDVVRDDTARFVQGTDRSHSGNVVEGKECGEILAAGDESLGGFVSELRRGGVAFELGHEAGMDGEIEEMGDVFDVVPADGGVGTELLTFHEGDLAVTELKEVL